MEGGSNQPPKGQKGHQEAISPQSFKDILINFHLRKELNCCKLFKIVKARGGFEKVCEGRLWKDIVSELELPSCTSASFTLKKHYQKCLLAYELNTRESTQETIFPERERVQNAFPQMQMLGKRKQKEEDGGRYPQSTHHHPHHPQTLQPPNPEMQGLHYIADVNPKSKHSLIKKIHLGSMIAESKRLVLAFESHIQREVNWALNVLSVFSCNVNAPFLLDNHPFLLESITAYLFHALKNIPYLNFVHSMLVGDSKGVGVGVGVEGHIHIHGQGQVQVQGQGHHIHNIHGSTTINTTNTTNLNIRGGRGAMGNTTHNIPNISNSSTLNPVVNTGRQSASGKQIQMQTNSEVRETTNPNTLLDLYTLDKKCLIQNTSCDIEILLRNNIISPFDLLRCKTQMGITGDIEYITELQLLEQVKTIILILRNLSLIKQNEHYIAKCNLFMGVCITLFSTYIDTELTHNTLDLITNIARHILIKDIPTPQAFLDCLVQCLMPSQQYTLNAINYYSNTLQEESLECIRRLSLSMGNEEPLQKLVLNPSFLPYLVSLLVNKNPENRESALEILCFVSDREMGTKVAIAKEPKCISRLIALLSSTSETVVEERICKLAALTLANLVLAPKNKEHLVPYEQELALVAFSDRRVSDIICNILADLDQYQILPAGGGGSHGTHYMPHVSTPNIARRNI